MMDKEIEVSGIVFVLLVIVFGLFLLIEMVTGLLGHPVDLFELTRGFFIWLFSL